MTAGPTASDAVFADLTDEPSGHLATERGRIAYWRAGTAQPDAPPLVCLHGGPGMPHDYLQPLAALARDREVIFYDQLGCGRSDRPVQPQDWTIESFVAELATVIRALALGRFHLFGNSWGGWLALEYTLGGPVRAPLSLVLSSSPPSVDRWIIDLAALRAALPAEVREVLNEHERAGTTDARAYRKAFAQFNGRHMCRVRPTPDPLRRAIAGFGQEVYEGLWGTSEFGPVTGALRGWDVGPRLSGINLPTLVTGGRYDEATPAHMAALADGIPGARLRIFENSSHMAFLEEPTEYVDELARFLFDVDEHEVAHE